MEQVDKIKKAISHIDDMTIGTDFEIEKRTLGMLKTFKKKYRTDVFDCLISQEQPYKINISSEQQEKICLMLKNINSDYIIPIISTIPYACDNIITTRKEKEIIRKTFIFKLNIAQFNSAIRYDPPTDRKRRHKFCSLFVWGVDNNHSHPDQPYGFEWGVASAGWHSGCGWSKLLQMSTDFINELEQFFFASKIQALVRGCRKRRIIENNKIKLENSKLKLLLKRSQAQTGPRDLIDNFTQDEVSENYLSDDITIGTVTSIGSQSSIQLLKHVQDLEKLVTMQAETIKKLTLMNNSSVSRNEGSTQCLRDSEIAQERLEAHTAQEEEEVEVVVSKWICPTDGKTYLKSGDGEVFDRETHEQVGIWNGETLEAVEEEETLQETKELDGEIVAGTHWLRDSEIAQERLEAHTAEKRRTNGERGGFAGFYDGEIVTLDSELNPT